MKQASVSSGPLLYDEKLRFIIKVIIIGANSNDWFARLNRQVAGDGTEIRYDRKGRFPHPCKQNEE